MSVLNPAGLGKSIKSRYLPSLQYPDYRKLWMATICSQSSAWALIVARGALAKTETGSDLWVGMVTFAAMIPSVIVSPLAGFLADRFDRRTVLAYAYGINLAHNLLLAVLVVTGAIEIWHLVLLSLLNGSARATQMPSAQALLPNTLPRERLFNAVALFQATQQGSRFIGPFLLLLMLWITGPWLTDNQDWVFFLCAGLYAIGLWIIFKIRTASSGVIESGAGKGVVFSNVVAGLSFMYRRPLVMSLVLLVVAHCAMTMSFESLFPSVSRDKLEMDPGAGLLAGFGYMMVAYGSAALVMALALAGVESERTRGRLFFWLAVLSGVTPIALAFSPNFPLAMLSVAGMGASQAGFMTLSSGMLQALAPDAIRGRMMAVYTWHIQGFMASFNLINGALTAINGLTTPIVLGAGGVGFIMVMAGSLARVPLRQLYGRGVPAEAQSDYLPQPRVGL